MKKEEEKIGTEKLGYKGQVNEKIEAVMGSGIPEEDLKEFNDRLIETASNNGESKMAEALEKIKEGVSLIDDLEFRGLALAMVMNELPLGMQLTLYKLQEDLIRSIATASFTSKVHEEMKDRPEAALEIALGLAQLCTELKKK